MILINYSDSKQTVDNNSQQEPVTLTISVLNIFTLLLSNAEHERIL